MILPPEQHKRLWFCSKPKDNDAVISCCSQAFDHSDSPIYCRGQLFWVSRAWGVQSEALAWVEFRQACSENPPKAYNSTTFLNSIPLS